MPRRFTSNRPPEPLFGDYTSRILFSLAAVLSVAVIITNLPGSETIEYTPWGRGEWSLNRGRGTISAHDVLTLYPSAQVISDVPAASEEAVPGDPASDLNARPKGEPNGVEPEPDPERRTFRSIATLGPDASKPRIIGGIQQLYLNVTYPKEAQRQRIQGRVIVHFVVHKTGRVSDIEVLRPLHPLCDSSVVRAVRETMFVPAEENGERVAVRMALPVRFQLLNVPGLDDFETTPADETTAGTAPTGTATDRAAPPYPEGGNIP